MISMRMPARVVAGIAMVLVVAVALTLLLWQHANTGAGDQPSRSAAADDTAKDPIADVLAKQAQMAATAQTAAQTASTDFDQLQSQETDTRKRPEQLTRKQGLKRLGLKAGAHPNLLGASNGGDTQADLAKINDCVAPGTTQEATDTGTSETRSRTALVRESTTDDGGSQGNYLVTLDEGQSCRMHFGKFSTVKIRPAVATVAQYELVSTQTDGTLKTSGERQLTFTPDDPGQFREISLNSGMQPAHTQLVLRLTPSTDVLLAAGSCASCDFRGVDFAGYDIDVPVDVSGSDFSGATVYNMTFNAAADFSSTLWGTYAGHSATLAYTQFKGGTFGDVVFDAIDIHNVEFASMKLNNLRLQNVVLDSTVTFPDTTWSDLVVADSTVEFPGPTYQAGEKGPTWHNLQFINTTLVADDRKSGSEPDKANFELLEGKKISNVSLEKSRFLGTPVQLSDTTWEGSSITETRLNGARLESANLSKANVSFSDFSSAMMIGADLSGVNGHGAVFTNANLGDAKFGQAQLGRGEEGSLAPAIFDHADMRSAEFVGADLRGASIQDAYVFDGRAPAKFEAAHLERARFDRSLFSKTDFNRADISDASFQSVQCISCVFTGSRLTDSSFRNAYLFGSDLSSAEVKGVDFGNADYATASAGTWTFNAGMGAIPPVPAYPARSMDDSHYANVATCPNGMPPNGGCSGRSVPANPPPRPAPCVSAGGLICVLRIATIAGTGTAGYSTGLGDNNVARESAFNAPAGVVGYAGSGNARLILISDTANNVVRAVDAITGEVSIFAGTPGQAGYAGDGGKATSASLNGPTGLATDSAGNVYVADTGNNRIRRITPDGYIDTFAGNGTAGSTGDRGASIKASLNHPAGVSTHCSASACDVYIADTGNNKIRIVRPTSNYPIDTFAGKGTKGNSGNNGPAVKAMLSAPQSVSVDSLGNVYIADTGNNVVRRVTPSGVIAAYKPDALDAFSKPPFTATKASSVFAGSDGSVLIAAAGRNQVSRWNLQGGNLPGVVVNASGEAGYTNDGGDSLAARLSNPQAVAALPWGGIAIADTTNNRIRLISTT